LFAGRPGRSLISHRSRITNAVIAQRRLTAIERLISEFPHSAPGVTQRSGVRVVAFLDLPYRLFYSVDATQSPFWRFGTHRVSLYLDEGHDQCRTRKGLQKSAGRLALEAV
jgi:hypothetical protein